jgi:3'-5' exonuclease
MKRLVLDIETVPLSLDFEDAEQNKKASLDALNGRVACIGGIIVDGYEAIHSIAFVSKNEREMLKDFWNFLRHESIRGFVAHNGMSFDLPFLWRRSVVQNVKPTMQFDLRRYRNDFIYDTMCVWGNWEPRFNPSLNSLATGLGVGQKNGSGGEVLDLWRDDRQKEIADYCLQDCWITYACYCRMNFEKFTLKNDLTETLKLDDGSVEQKTVGTMCDLVAA